MAGIGGGADISRNRVSIPVVNSEETKDAGSFAVDNFKRFKETLDALEFLRSEIQFER